MRKTCYRNMISLNYFIFFWLWDVNQDRIVRVEMFKSLFGWSPIKWAPQETAWRIEVPSQKMILNVQLSWKSKTKIYVRSLSLDYGRRGAKKDIQKKYGHLTAHLCSNSDLFSLPWGSVNISNPLAPPVPSSMLHEQRWGSSPHTKTRSTRVMCRARVRQSVSKKGVRSFSPIFFITLKNIPFLSRGFGDSGCNLVAVSSDLKALSSAETDLERGLS